MSISGYTKLICLLGNPAKHSLSPFIHNKAFSDMNLDYRYLTFEPIDFAQAVIGLKSMGVKGFNLTMPYKKDIISHLDFISEQAKACHSVNTVDIKDGRLYGYTTDGDGFLIDLKKAYLPYDIKGKTIVILGTGGAALSIITSLYKEDVKVIVLGRRGASFTQMVDIMGGLYASNVHYGYINDRAYFNSTIIDSDIIVNASSVGMQGDESLIEDFSLISSDKLVYDIIYKPFNTRLLKEAKKRGAKVVNGIGMLVEQANLAFELWTGKSFNSEYITKYIIRKNE